MTNAHDTTPASEPFATLGTFRRSAAHLRGLALDDSAVQKIARMSGGIANSIA